MAASTAIAAIRTLRLEPVYAASARIQLAQEPLDPTAPKYRETWEGVAPDYLNTQLRVIESHSVAKKVLETHPEVARELEVDLGGGAPGTGDGRQGDMDALAAAFRGGVGVTQVKDTYLVDVTYQSTLPTRCDRYANALADTYVRLLEEQSGRRSRETEEKLAEQLSQLRLKLDQSERELRDFLVGAQTPLFESYEELLVGRISQNNVDLQGVQRERIRLEADLEAIQRVLDLGRPIESAPAIARNELVSRLRADLAQAELDLSLLSERYGASWPQTEAARSRRDQLKLHLREEVDGLRARLQGEQVAAASEEQGLLARGRALHDEARALASRANMYENLKGQVEANRKLFEEFATRLSEVSRWSQVRISDVRFVDPARGSVRVGPNHTRNVSMGLFAGLAVGVALALLLERLADRLRTPPEAARALRLPVIGVVPEVREVGPEALDLYGVTRPHSVYAEAFRRLRVQLDAVGSFPAEGSGVLVCSSGVPQEGKTLCAINIAIAEAQAGRRTLLIDGDMRGPRVHRALELDVAPGLADVLASKALWGSVVRATPLPNLSVITAGRSDENPAEVLARGTGFGDLLARLRGHFDRIIVDTAPAAAVTDATLMAPFADATLLVVSGRASSRSASTLAKTELSRVGARLVGVVFNHQSASDAGYYYHRYYSRYSQQAQQEEQARASSRGDAASPAGDPPGPPPP